MISFSGSKERKCPHIKEMGERKLVTLQKEPCVSGQAYMAADSQPIHTVHAWYNLLNSVNSYEQIKISLK